MKHDLMNTMISLHDFIVMHKFCSCLNFKYGFNQINNYIT